MQNFIEHWTARIPTAKITFDGQGCFPMAASVNKSATWVAF